MEAYKGEESSREKREFVYQIEETKGDHSSLSEARGSSHTKLKTRLLTGEKRANLRSRAAPFSVHKREE